MLYAKMDMYFKRERDQQFKKNKKKTFLKYCKIITSGNTLTPMQKQRLLQTSYYDLQIELLKATDELTSLSHKIWDTKIWFKEQQRSIFLKLPLKRRCKDVHKLHNYCAEIKIFIRIIQNRIVAYMDKELPVEKTGFGNGRGNKDQIANVRWIAE